MTPCSVDIIKTVNSISFTKTTMGTATAAFKLAHWSKFSTPMLFRMIVTIAVVFLGMLLSHILEPVDELNMFLREDLTEVVIADKRTLVAFLVKSLCDGLVLSVILKYSRSWTECRKKTILG